MMIITWLVIRVLTFFIIPVPGQSIVVIERTSDDFEFNKNEYGVSRGMEMNAPA